MKNLTSKELDIMKVLWETGALKPGEIQERLPDETNNASLRSLLLVLVEKGHVAREKEGKAFRYRATTSQEGVFQRMARRMMDTFTGGSPSRLVAQLVESEDLSDKEIQQLQSILKKRKSR